MRLDRILAWPATVLVAAAGAAVFFPAGPLSGQDAGYLNHSDLTRQLRDLAGSSDLVTLNSLGESGEGREIWLLEIGSPGGAEHGTRPALLVVGNLEGDHLIGSALALETVRYFLEQAGTDPEMMTRLERQVIYVIPRLNPDGAEAVLDGPDHLRRTNARPKDDDNDGRVDEDPADDLNGDGVVTVMRVLDPFGAYMVDPDDPRLMKAADPAKGEAGAYTLYWEGQDSDGDGFYNEDGPGGVDLNRNFQHAYPYFDADAGPHMVSEPETRALMDFMTSHRNVGAIITYGHTDNLVTPPNAAGGLAGASAIDLMAFADASFDEMGRDGVFGTSGGGGGGFGGFGRFGRGGGPGPVLRGAQPGRDNDPASGRRPSTTVHRADQEYFRTVSEAYREITGIEKVGINREPAGAFFQFGYFQFGVPAFSTQGWSLPQAEAGDEADPEATDPDLGGDEADPPPATQQARGGRPAGGRPPGGGGQSPGDGAGDAGADATILAAMDAAGIDAFIDWAPFDHPQLGEIEIGGFRPGAISNPSPDQIPDLGRAHGEFAARLASMLPSVSIVNTDVTAHGGGVFTVTVEVQNDGYLPTSIQHGVVSRSVQPTTVQIQVSPEDILTGDAKSTTIQQLQGSGSRESVTWVIRGREGASVEITVRSQKGGSDSTTVTLR